jgi:hypothetical protein
MELTENAENCTQYLREESINFGTIFVWDIPNLLCCNISRQIFILFSSLNIQEEEFSAADFHSISYSLLRDTIECFYSYRTFYFFEIMAHHEWYASLSKANVV